MMNNKPSGIAFNYVLVVNPGTPDEQVVYKHTARYTVVSEALKLEKKGISYEIMKYNILDQRYERDEVGHEQVETRPGIIAANAAKHGKVATVSTSTVDKELIDQMNLLAEACRAIAGAERKGHNSREALTEWAQEAIRTMEAAGFTEADIKKLVKENVSAF